jgi:hypothetical protein
VIRRVRIDEAGTLAELAARLFAQTSAHLIAADDLSAHVADMYRAVLVWLSVWDQNPRAIAFYRKVGFEDVGSTEFGVGSDRQTDRIMAIIAGTRVRTAT